MGKKSLVHGVGVNDLPNGFAQKGKNPIYIAWSEMLRRCYSPSYLSLNPTYIGCSVCDEWHVLSAFVKWAESQDWRGMVLDKDLLHPGNKIYSAETCAFVPKWVNTFLANLVPRPRSLPMGVVSHGNRFRARHNNGGASIVIGSFATAAEAHLAYSLHRLEEIQERINRYSESSDSNPKILNALVRLYESETVRVNKISISPTE